MINLHEIVAILEDTSSVQIGDREEIGSGSVNGVEEEEDTGRKDSFFLRNRRMWCREFGSNYLWHYLMLKW